MPARSARRLLVTIQSVPCQIRNPVIPIIAILQVLDTPGHQDFGGEVERILSIVDGVILVVDFWSGPMSQTRFVLSKALMNPKIIPIVVANKLDRDVTHRSECEFDNEVFGLFVGLNPSDEQMEYPTLYGSAKHGWIEKTMEECRGTEHPKGIMEEGNEIDWDEVDMTGVWLLV